MRGCRSVCVLGMAVGMLREPGLPGETGRPASPPGQMAAGSPPTRNAVAERLDAGGAHGCFNIQGLWCMCFVMDIASQGESGG